MSAINSFYRDPNAVAYATQLFSTRRAAAEPVESTAPVRFDAGARTADDPLATGRMTAGQRALARIIDILTLGGGDADGDQARVRESLGYITEAAGTADKDALVLSGRGISAVDTGDGDDTVTARGGSLDGVRLGAGNDTARASADRITDIDAGDGADTLELTGRLLMGVTGGAGEDRITAAGDRLLGIAGGDGADTLVLEGRRIDASGGKGDDTISLTGTGDAAGAGAGAGDIVYGFAAGDGKDRLTSNSPLSIRLSGYSETDLTVTGSATGLTLAARDGNDSITIDLSAARGLKTEDKAAGAVAYRFELDQGQLMLRIG